MRNLHFFILTIIISLDEARFIDNEESMKDLKTANERKMCQCPKCATLVEKTVRISTYSFCDVLIYSCSIIYTP